LLEQPLESGHVSVRGHRGLEREPLQPGFPEQRGVCPGLFHAGLPQHALQVVERRRQLAPPGRLVSPLLEARRIARVERELVIPEAFDVLERRQPEDQDETHRNEQCAAAHT
jgi:hypothetical protein